MNTALLCWWSGQFLFHTLDKGEEELGAIVHWTLSRKRTSVNEHSGQCPPLIRANCPRSAILHKALCNTFSNIKRVSTEILQISQSSTLQCIVRNCNFLTNFHNSAQREGERAQLKPKEDTLHWSLATGWQCTVWNCTVTLFEHSLTVCWLHWKGKDTFALSRKSF